MLLLAATNFADRIDEALIRPGRLGVHLNPRTETEAPELFRYYLKDTVTEDQLATLARFAMTSPTLTPARISGWVATARARAMHSKQEIDFDRVMTAVVGDDNRTPEQLYRAAVHEAGHAVIARGHGIPVSSISIVRGAGIEGRVIADFRSDILDRAQVEHVVRTLLAGRAADLEILGFTDAGSADDLAMARSLLSDAASKYGLYDQLAVFGTGAIGLDSAARQMVEATLQALFVETWAMVAEHRPEIEMLAQRLVETRVLSYGHARTDPQGHP